MPACVSEMKSKKVNNTWKLVPSSEAKHVLRSMRVIRTKYFMLGNGGSGQKAKGRILARGDQQVEGIEYEDTFSPVVKFTSIRALLALVAVEYLELDQMDVVTAFLNRDLDEEIYMEQLEGFVDPEHPKHV